MPIPVPAWAGDTFPAAKSLNMACYTTDGTADNPTGIALLALRPILLEAYTATTTFPAATAGTQTSMSTSGTTTACLVVLDAAGYYGQSCDLPGKGYYAFTAAIKGTAGDGQTAGGWMLMYHLAPLVPTSTQTSVSADLLSSGGANIAGTRQAPSTANHSAPFYLDLVSVGQLIWHPAVTVRDSSSASTTNAANTTDASGETPRLYAIWAGVSASSSGFQEWTVGGVYSWTAPAGVTSVTPACIAAGSGSGAGNAATGGTEYGGGGAGGAEFASGPVAVTPGNTYPVTVGAAGLGGTAPGGNGTVGGNSFFSGDSTTITAHAGGAGLGATTTGDGTGGAPGTGSAAPTHHDGGAGNSGTTAETGGGGGSSAGPAAAGNAATDGTGAPAPAGGGPGGAAGSTAISVVQVASASAPGVGSYTASFSSPVQAGNAVILTTVTTSIGVAGQNGRVQSAVLDDGTALAVRSQEQISGAPQTAYTEIWDAGAVAGGEQVLTISIGGASNRRSLAYIYEVSGLGSSLTVDTSTSNSGKATTYSSGSATTADAPELWLAVCGWQGTDPTSIYSAGSPWTQQAQISNGSGTGGNNIALRPGYYLASAAGKMTYGGNMTGNTQTAAIAVAYTSSAPTSGSSPATGPGGGAGGGLGPSGNGAAGVDGQVSATWTGVSGSGYGQPALPAPYAAYTPATTVGTSAASNVNLNTSVVSTLNFLANPPMMRIGTEAGQSITTGTLTQVTFTGATADVDNYSGWSAGANQYVVQRDGLYLIHGLACFTQASGGTRQAGVTVNGTTYWGPPSVPATSGTTHVAKTQILSLRAGDIVRLACRQDSGSSVTLATTSQSRLLAKWLGLPGTPAGVWTPPDATFRWQSGTAGENLGGDLSALMQQHLGNDLNFLCQPPFLLAYQTAAQSSLTVGSWSTVTLDTVAGIVHADTGDSYAGWTSGAANKYVAQQPGWYLSVLEVFTGSSSVAGSTVIAGIAASTSGGVAPSATPDWGQQLVATSTAAVGGGACAVSMVYLLAGESLTPQVQAKSFPAAYGTLVGTANGGTYASHFEVAWISE